MAARNARHSKAETIFLHSFILLIFIFEIPQNLLCRKFNTEQSKLQYIFNNLYRVPRKLL